MSAFSGSEDKLPWNSILVRHDSHDQLRRRIDAPTTDRIALIYGDFVERCVKLTESSHTKRADILKIITEHGSCWYRKPQIVYLLSDDIAPKRRNDRIEWYHLYHEVENHLIELLENFCVALPTDKGGTASGTNPQLPGHRGGSASEADLKKIKRWAFVAYRNIQHMQYYIRKWWQADAKGNSTGFQFVLLEADDLKPSEWDDRAIKLMFHMFKRDIENLQSEKTRKSLKFALWHGIPGARRERHLTESQKHEYGQQRLKVLGATSEPEEAVSDNQKRAREHFKEDYNTHMIARQGFMRHMKKILPDIPNNEEEMTRNWERGEEFKKEREREEKMKEAGSTEAEENQEQATFYKELNWLIGQFSSTAPQFDENGQLVHRRLRGESPGASAHRGRSSAYRSGSRSSSGGSNDTITPGGRSGKSRRRRQSGSPSQRSEG